MFRGGAADTPIPERWRSAHRQPATLEMLGPPAALHLRPCPRPSAGTVCRPVAFEDDALHALAFGRGEQGVKILARVRRGMIPHCPSRPRFSSNSRRARYGSPIVGRSSSQSPSNAHERHGRALRGRVLWRSDDLRACRNR